MEKTLSLWSPQHTVAQEIQIIYKRPLFSSLSHITGSKDANYVIREFIGKTCLDVQEYFWVMTLSCANRVLGISNISKGNVNEVVVSIPMIAQSALLTNAKSVILFHNHPSGEKKPSAVDVKLTANVKTALSHLDLEVLDHLILTSEGYFSMADERLL